MNKSAALFVCIALQAGLALPALAQTTPAPTITPARPAAAPEDVATLDAILAALYDVISGPTDEARDWDRFRSLFYPGAIVVQTGTNRAGRVFADVTGPEDYVAAMTPILREQPFFEREIARRTETFGPLTQVFSTYEARDARDAATPFIRGINGIQLLNDGARWWIITLTWSGETPTLPLPPAYLPPPAA